MEKEKDKQSLLEQQLREQHANALLNQEKLKNEIETRNRKLTAKALEISSRNQTLEYIIQEISNNIDIHSHPKLLKLINDIKHHIKNNQDYNDFFRHFEEVNPNFIKNIKEKHPELSANDLRFISYLYMNLSTKEISSLLNITADACRKRKERLIRKMNLPENSNLYSYISTI